MVDVKELRRKMREYGLSIDDLAKRMGISRATLYRKFNSAGKNFSIKEANSIVKELKLSKEEASDIFLIRMSHVMRLASKGVQEDLQRNKYLMKEGEKRQ
ncbi:helix-turn-helix domain-containing protein [Anaerovorax odorimutans]|uniref:Helix-turn-helix domain-containing protein n=1 Tax=Anaerovorax odorimutans TaxID=109327 RepID=A0ABT1RQH4_9FIRM|nr:helix-turn-helix domain-containing protein [Anaerovorax odorimutans]MCQ4637136.1 helix-turn-helix domain-containing protein [Anaerovorax odorimutans]